jgi:hypothetical protein
MRYKMTALGIGAETNGKSAATPRIDSRNRTRHRIALITDDRGLDASVDYAADAGERRDVTIDPPIRGADNSVAIMPIEDVVPKREGRFAVPLLRIEDRPAAHLAEQVMA